MKIAVTGHRPNKLGGYDFNNPIRKWVREELRKKMVEEEATHGISGMALGVDQDFAEVCIDLGITLIAAVPFKGQEAVWLPASQEKYWKILEKAKEVEYVCDPGYAAWKMQKRNEWMVDHADKIIAVWDGTSGGTANCVQYAQKVGRKIFIIDPKDYERRQV